MGIETTTVVIVLDCSVVHTVVFFLEFRTVVFVRAAAL